MINFKGSKVFVTGADGFIGSHLVEKLVFLGADVRALTFYNSWNSKGWLKDCSTDVLNNVELFPGDVRDPERMMQGIHDCEYVFHLSSLVAIPYSYESPRSYLDTNVTGAFNVLQACRGSESLMFTSCIHLEVYGSAQKVPIPEDHPLVGQSPYSASKIAADKLVESYHLSFGLPVVTARPFNTFGPRQTARAVIPTIASQLLLGCNELRLGSLTPTRDFNFVLDTVAAMVELIKCDEADGEVINIGTGNEWSIGNTLDILSEITGKSPLLFQIVLVFARKKVRLID